MKKLFQILWKLSLIFLGFLVLIFLVINIQSHNYITRNQENFPPVSAAIILGAGILNNDKLSPIFKDRVDTAISLYKKGTVTTILVSGDDGTSTHNEVNPARDYLLSQGIPSKDIFLDHAGFDTYSSMYRAKNVFLVTSAIIVTQSFHLPRSVFIARTLGIDAYGTPADQHLYSFKNNIREFFADTKAFFDIVRNRKPKYLGEKIPITGDSSESI